MNTPTQSHRGAVRRGLVAVVVTVALVVGSAAVALTVSSAITARHAVTGKSVAAMAKGLAGKSKAKLSAKVLKGPLLPGAKHPLKVTIANPTSKSMLVSGITVKAAKPKGFPGCKPSWVKATPFKAKKKIKPLVVKPHKKVVKKLSISFTNLTTVNQDACKGARFPLKISVQTK
jgi:hypothetical protein